jgi:hypothetical protein
MSVDLFRRVRWEIYIKIKRTYTKVEKSGILWKLHFYPHPQQVVRLVPSEAYRSEGMQI